MTTDQDWEEWGSSDPYFGVLSSSQFRRQNLSQKARDAFFLSGKEHVDLVFGTIRRVFDSEFSPQHTLDFGCGVGRLLIPLARSSSHAVGVDVSKSMLREARINCDRHHVDNVVFVQSDDALSAVTGEFDLIHSSVVLQHIAWSRGKGLIDVLLKRVRPGGMIALQFYHHCNAPRIVRALVRLRYASGIANKLRNLRRGVPLSEPAMQLHIYDLSIVLRQLRLSGFTEVYLCQSVDGNGEFESSFVFARRTGPEQERRPVLG